MFQNINWEKKVILLIIPHRDGWKDGIILL